MTEKGKLTRRLRRATLAELGETAVEQLDDYAISRYADLLVERAAMQVRSCAAAPRPNERRRGCASRRSTRPLSEKPRPADIRGGKYPREREGRCRAAVDRSCANRQIRASGACSRTASGPGDAQVSAKGGGLL